MSKKSKGSFFNHEETVKLLPLYLSGELDQEKSEQISRHLDDCEACRKEAEDLKNALPELQVDAAKDSLSNPSIDRILRRSRLKALFTNSIISFLIGIGIILFLCLLMFVTRPILYSKGEEIRNVVNLGVSFTQPGVFAYSGGGIGYWGSINMEGKLRRCLGGTRRWDAGEITGTVNLWGTQPFKYDWIADRETHYQFELPQGDTPPMSEKNIELLWESLERLPSSTVAEMAFSLDQYYDLKDIPKLPGEHLVVSWYTLDTGERARMEQEPNYTPSPLGINPNEYWKYIPEQPQKPKDFYNKLLYWFSGKRSYVTVRPTFPDGYLEKVAWMSERPKLFFAIAPTVQADIPIEQRYQYLKEHGLKTYGIVIQGPVNELLALRGMPQLRRPQLGPVEWWLPDTTIYP